MSELRQRRPPLSDEAYLAAIRLMPCCVCGASAPSDAAHLRMSGAGWGSWGEGKESTGGSVKPDDNYAVPLCRPRYTPDPVARILKPDKPLKLVNVGCHGRQHGHDQKFIREVVGTYDVKLEEAFWRATGKNPFMIAATLYQEFGTKLRRRKTKRRKAWARAERPRPKKQTGPKIQNRGFDKTKRRKFNGKVEKR